MAAIDPSEEPDLEVADDKTKPRATLKLVRVPAEMLEDSDDDDEDFEDVDDDDEDSGEEEVNGGPSHKKTEGKKSIKPEEDDEDDEDMEDDSEDEAAAEALLAKLMKAEKKGKSVALDGEDDDDEDDDDSEESMGIDEVVICTLDPERVRYHSITFLLTQMLTKMLELPTDPGFPRR